MWRTFCSGTSLSSEKGCVDKVVTSVFYTLSHLSTSEGRLNYAGCWQCLACVCVCLLYSELWLDEGSISVLELCSYLCFLSWGVPSIQTMPLATPHLLLGPSEGNQTQTCIVCLYSPLRFSYSACISGKSSYLLEKRHLRSMLAFSRLRWKPIFLMW